jgi:Icc-related predicted phosphoesterase
MKTLICADIHGRRDWLDWIAANVHQCEIVLLAGDLIETVGDPSALPAAWAVVKNVVHFLEASGATVCLAEGNHDAGAKLDPWFHLHRKPRRRHGVWVVGLPWLDFEFRWVEALRQTADRTKELLIAVQHEPPVGMKIGVPGNWDSEAYHALDFAPHIVVSGHIHEAPFSSGGSWWDNHDRTYFFNPGYRPYCPIPCHIVLDFTQMTATWYPPRGGRTIQLEGLPKPA